MRHIISVESDASFIEKFKKIEEIGAACQCGRLEIIHADIGRTIQAGYPVEANSAMCLNYTLRLWGGRRFETIDLCLIDGRFREATAALALIYLPECTFLWHDFCTRWQYHGILPFISVLDVEASMIAYRGKSNIQYNKLLSYLCKRLFVPL